jgi:aromatic-L-amino-acid decarboxylase
MSDQTHSSMIRAAWIAGIPRAHVRIIATDDAFRMRTDRLADAIARDRTDGLLPMMVIANGGTTNTGAVDPMHDIAALRDREQLWMHVDAAYGGFSVLTERGAHAMAGVGLADTITMDPHKWLYVPFECGCLMAREPARLKSAFQIFPDYLKDVEVRGDEVNFADYGVQLTRYARALKVWLSVNYFGTSALSAAIDRTMDLAAYAERLMRAEDAIEILAPAQLGVVCFRVHPRGVDDAAELDALNERVNTAVNATGRYYISSTRLRGAFSLRLCVLGFRTAEEDVEGVVRAVVAAGA